jgi:serine/threonine protein phosphatase PrpC
MNHSLNKNSDQLMDKSGSCAIFAFIIEDDVFIGNIGDSRAILSIGNGKKVVSLSIDHKPNEENETRRILANGGKIYQCETYGKSINIPCLNEKYLDQILLGPHRVSPGRLSVSRTFGDAKAKLEKFGGIQGVIIAIPDVFKIKIKKDHDFIILVCIYSFI